MKNKVELLAPAGDISKGKVALNYGADAIFLGAKAFSLRARSSNFDFNDIQEMISIAHKQNKKIYIVTNVICHNSLLNSINEFLENISKLNPDGCIVADPMIINLMKKKFKNLEIHISTQQSITNSKSALFWKRNSATRVVLARELTLEEIKEITKNINNEIEIEIFIHGAVCISFSGRCMMSNNFSLRDANVGGCAQSCRWEYNVENNNIKNKEKLFTMSAKDMAQINNIDELIKLNIASFKVEGRMKTEHYLANVIKNYRKAIDDSYLKLRNHKKEYNELLKSANREFDTAFMNGQPGFEKMLYHETKSKLSQNFIIEIFAKEQNFFIGYVKNNFNKDQFVEIMTPNNLFETKIDKILDHDSNEELFYCPTPMQKIKISFSNQEIHNCKDEFIYFVRKK